MEASATADEMVAYCIAVEVEPSSGKGPIGSTIGFGEEVFQSYHEEGLDSR